MTNKKFTSFIALDELAIWGFCKTLGGCKKHAKFYRDGNLSGLNFAEATTKARKALEARGSDALKELVFDGGDEYCWHKSEA